MTRVSAVAPVTTVGRVEKKKKCNTGTPGRSDNNKNFPHLTSYFEKKQIPTNGRGRVD